MPTIASQLIPGLPTSPGHPKAPSFLVATTSFSPTWAAISAGPVQAQTCPSPHVDFVKTQTPAICLTAETSLCCTPTAQPHLSCPLKSSLSWEPAQQVHLGLPTPTGTSSSFPVPSAPSLCPLQLSHHHVCPEPPPAPCSSCCSHLSLCTRQRWGCVTSIFWTRFSHQAAALLQGSQIALCPAQDRAMSHHLVNWLYNHSTSASPEPAQRCRLFTPMGNVTPRSLAKVTVMATAVSELCCVKC